MVLTKSNRKTLWLDLILVGALCLVPAASHLTTLPLVAFEPMRIALFAAMLLSANRYNGYLMALALPLLSCAIGGMPAPATAGIMAVELLVNVALFRLFSCRGALKPFPAMLIAIVGAKATYYALKAMLLSSAVLIGTALWRQAFLAVVFAAAYALLSRRRA